MTTAVWGPKHETMHNQDMTRNNMGWNPGFLSTIAPMTFLISGKCNAPRRVLPTTCHSHLKAWHSPRHGTRGASPTALTLLPQRVAFSSLAQATSSLLVPSLSSRQGPLPLHTSLHISPPNFNHFSAPSHVISNHHSYPVNDTILNISSVLMFVHYMVLPSLMLCAFYFSCGQTLIF